MVRGYRPGCCQPSTNSKDGISEMKYVPEDQTVSFAFTTQDANGAAAFTKDATNPVYVILDADPPVVQALGDVEDLTDDAVPITGGYSAVVDTTTLTLDQQYDVVVKGTVGGNTYTAKVGEFTTTSLADLNQIEKLDQRAWHGVCTSTTLTASSFSATLYDGDDNELTLDTDAFLTAQQQLKNRVVSFNGDQTAVLRGQTAQIASFADGTDEITITLSTGQDLSVAPAVNDTFLISVF